MARTDERYAVNLSTEPGAGPAGEGRVRRAEGPFCVALVGDFGGAAARGEAQSAQAPPLLVDRDDIDEVLSKLSPSLMLPLGDGQSMRLTFRSLEDFHPDRLYERLPLFQAMAELRDRLSSPGRAAPSDGPIAAEAGPVRAEDLLSSGGLLDRIAAASGADIGSSETALEGAPAGRTRETTGDPLQAFLSRIVAPHVVREPGADRLAARERLDVAIGEGLRAVLHDSRYQRLEALWRAVDLLVRRLETGPDLKIYLVDGASLDFLASDPPGTAGAFWSMCVLDQFVTPGADSVAHLRGAAASAVAAGAVLIANADTRLAGITTAADLTEPERWDTPDEAWSAFQRTAEARAVGLVAPRFLVRDPYGRANDPCDAFPLEEMAEDPPSHGDFLWAGGAFAAALIIARAFGDAGWRLGAALRPDIDGLPLHATEGGTSTKPCAESWMDERAAQRLLDKGIMALASVKHTDRVHLVRVQSAAHPTTALAGRWS